MHMCRYATERWETVLHYMVASSQQGGISADAVRTLLQVTSSSVITRHSEDSSSPSGWSDES